MAGNREQQMYEITKQLEEGVKELFTSERYAEYLKTMSKFYNYSFNNTVLIALQRPEATLVAGYSAWQKNFHRQVKKGEKGIPVSYTRKESSAASDVYKRQSMLFLIFG